MVVVVPPASCKCQKCVTPNDCLTTALKFSLYFCLRQVSGSAQVNVAIRWRWSSASSLLQAMNVRTTNCQLCFIKHVQNIIAFLHNFITNVYLTITRPKWSIFLAASCYARIYAHLIINYAFPENPDKLDWGALRNTFSRYCENRSSSRMFLFCMCVEVKSCYWQIYKGFCRKTFVTQLWPARGFGPSVIHAIISS